MSAPKGNKNRLGKLKYKTVEELQSAIDEYFDYCDNRIRQIYSAKAEGVIEVLDPAPYTMSGLAYELGLSRQGLLNYSNNELFFDAIKKARDKVERDVEERMNDKEKFTPGLIFNAKNNFGWRDKSEVEQTVHLPKPILGDDDVSQDNSTQED
jgi:hypothetical protein